MTEKSEPHQGQFKPGQSGNPAGKPPGLHHVLDVSATIMEMLRVVKIGGSVVTSNDSYSPDAFTEEADARFWNDHPAVLAGINENRPHLKQFIDPLLAHANILDVEFWTSSAWEVGKPKAKNFLGPKRWNLATEHELLRNSAGGGIFMRVTPKSPVPSDSGAVTAPIIRPSEIASWIGDKTRAMAEIAHLMPPELMMPPFPGPAGNTKFQVLNGWRWSEPGEFGKQAYQCGRWFLTRRQEQTVMECVVRAPLVPAAPDVSIEIVVDGSIKARDGVARGRPHYFEVDVSALPIDTLFCVEVRLVEKDLHFEHALFQVEKLEVTKKLAQDQKLDLVLHELGRLNATLDAQIHQQTIDRDEPQDLIAKLKQMKLIRPAARLGRRLLQSLLH